MWWQWEVIVWSGWLKGWQGRNEGLQGSGWIGGLDDDGLARVVRQDISLLVDLHTPMPQGRTLKHTEKNSCGFLSTRAAQHVLAAKWASEVINNQSRSQGVHIGLISVGDPDVVEETVRTLHAFQIPLILASPRLAEMVRQEGNILTTAPDMSSVVKPLVTVGKNLGITAMSLISSCEHSIKKFGEAAMQHHIYIGRILEIPKHSRIIGDVVKKFLDESEANETIGLLLEPEEIYTIVQYLRNYKSNNNKLLLGTIGLNKNFLKLWKNVFNGGYLIEPHMAELPDFRNYFLNVLQSAQKNDNKLVKEYISTTYDCNWNNTEVKGIDDCSHLEIKQLAGKLQIDLEVTFVVKAVSAFSAAVFLVQAQLCNENPLNCSVSHTNLQQDILATLSQLSFTSQHDAPFELQGTTLHITHDGQLVSNKYIIYHIQNNGDVSVSFVDDSKEFIVKELIVLSVCGTLLQHWVLKPSYVIEELSTTAKKQSNYIVNKLHGIPWDSGDVYYSLLESLISHATTRAETVYVKGAEKKKFLAKCMPCLRLT
uniref:Uncharacterized protein n=1 Tax=Timema cristinae TaxID=61476 RepID=A0A7R9GVX5_TIMCR|nr:unnamed protein product [Timema cristinae]